MPDFNIGDKIQEINDKDKEDNQKYFVMAINEPKSTYSLLFQSNDDNIFYISEHISFRIPKDETYPSIGEVDPITEDNPNKGDYHIIEIEKDIINSSYESTSEKPVKINLQLATNNKDKLYGGKRRKSIRKPRVKKQYTKRFKKHNSRKYK